MKSQSYASLKRKLDKIFSEWIRRKDCGSYGRAMCVSCGMVAGWREMQCGHFIPRHYLSGRWCPENCFVQCPSCNVFKRGNYPNFALYIVQQFGQKRLQELISLKHKTMKLRSGDLLSMIEEYSEKLKGLPA